MYIAENVKTIKLKIEEAAISVNRNPSDISLLAATKMNNSERVMEAIAAGVTHCGENRVQELLEKSKQNAYKGSTLHFIGHLQKNKVKNVVGLCDLIQSVDSKELMDLINKRALSKDIVQKILLEINIGGESAKSGISPEELPSLLEYASSLPAISVRGLMAIPPISHTQGENRPYFAAMRNLFVDNSSKKYDNVFMEILSMGMSGDFEDAIKEGSTMVRIGTGIFGARNYGNP